VTSNVVHWLDMLSISLRIDKIVSPVGVVMVTWPL